MPTVARNPDPIAGVSLSGMALPTTVVRYGTAMRSCDALDVTMRLTLALPGAANIPCAGRAFQAVTEDD